MKDYKKSKIKTLFLENIHVRNIVYFSTLIIAGILLPTLLYWLVYLCLLTFELTKKFPTENINGHEVRIRGVVDKKMDAFNNKVAEKTVKLFKNIAKGFKTIKNLIIPEKEFHVIDLKSELLGEREKIEENNAKEEAVTNIEEIHKRLQEININGSIVRDPKEIAEEKEEYLSLLNILKQYQGTDNKEKIINDTPVPTIEIPDDYNNGHVYKKK